MKKFLSMFLLLVFSFCSVAAAEGIDLTAMTLDELVALHQSVDAEIDARIGCEPSILPAGLYIAGESIKAGSYTLSCRKDVDWSQSIDIVTFQNQEVYNKAISENDETLATFHTTIYTISDGIAFVHLEEGTILIVSEACVVETSKPDWMP